MKIGLRWLIITGFFYLYIPFAIFSIGFLRPAVGFPAALVVGIILFRYLYRLPVEGSMEFKKSELWITMAIVFVWILLSGIGGYAFQNCDHHIRNAIFHDLIDLDWPVRYTGDTTASYSLVYYIGYWLPSAIIGKLLGWNIAELFLFLWTWAGIGMTILLLRKVINTSLIKIVLFFILFSGMDALGVLYDNSLIKGAYPGFWPPISHLEWWARIYQFSAFTTQLFWVFNQAVPVWVCVALHLAVPDRKRALLLWSFCFFLAPIPSIGLLPFVLLELPNKLFNPARLRFSIKAINPPQFAKDLWSDLRSAVTLENAAAGGIVLFISAAYFYSNSISAATGGESIETIPLLVYIPFLLCEGLLLWLILLRKMHLNLEWYIVGIILLASPLIKIGQSLDFCMRASIPALFILMAGIGNGLLDRQLKYRKFVVIMLFIGALTPVYEINRSVYRSAVYLSNWSYFQNQPKLTPLEAIRIHCYPENDHPNSMVADDFCSLANFQSEQLPNFIADVENSFYKLFLEKGND